MRDGRRTIASVGVDASPFVTSASAPQPLNAGVRLLLLTNMVSAESRR